MADNRLFLKDGGNIGIGVADPDALLEVAGTSHFQGDMVVDGTVDGVDIAARDHAESHTVASHSDTTATGAELDTLTDNSMADTLHRHSELSANDGTPDRALVVDASGNVGIQKTSPLGILHISDGSASGSSAFSASNANTITGQPELNADTGSFWVNFVGYLMGTTRFRDFHVGDGKQNIVTTVDGSAASFGIGTSAPTAKLHVDQSSTTKAVPVLKLDQADVSEPFVDFIGTATADANSSISTLNTSGATTDHIQIDLNGTKAWIAVSTNAPT